MSPRDLVSTLLASLGTAEAPARTAELLALGAAGSAELLRALGEGAPFGAPDANGRAVFEDLETVLVGIAHAHPELLVAAVTTYPSLRESFAFVSALSRIAGPAAEAVLGELLHARAGAIRWLVFKELIRREHPVALAHLGDALTDRDGLVVYDAVSAAKRFGDATHLPRLRAIAESDKTPLGTKSVASEAIEAISARQSR